MYEYICKSKSRYLLLIIKNKQNMSIENPEDKSKENPGNVPEAAEEVTRQLQEMAAAEGKKSQEKAIEENLAPRDTGTARTSLFEGKVGKKKKEDLVPKNEGTVRESLFEGKIGKKR